jgi:hypothetical protein
MTFGEREYRKMAHFLSYFYVLVTDDLEVLKIGL